LSTTACRPAASAETQYTGATSLTAPTTASSRHSRCTASLGNRAVTHIFSAMRLLMPLKSGGLDICRIPCGSEFMVISSHSEPLSIRSNGRRPETSWQVGCRTYWWFAVLDSPSTL
jgi:hypothetical protein